VSAAYALLKEATQKRETQLMQSNVQ